MTAHLSISQSDCKGLRLINGDTINLYDSTTVQKMNKTFNDLDLALALVKKYKDDIEDHVDYEKSLEEENQHLFQQIDVKNRINEEKTIQNNILTSENKKQGKKIKVLKKTRNLFGTIGVVVGGVITYYGQKIIK